MACNLRSLSGRLLECPSISSAVLRVNVYIHDLHAICVAITCLLARRCASLAQAIHLRKTLEYISNRNRATFNQNAALQVLRGMATLLLCLTCFFPFDCRFSVMQASRSGLYHMSLIRSCIDGHLHVRAANLWHLA